MVEILLKSLGTALRQWQGVTSNNFPAGPDLTGSARQPVRVKLRPLTSDHQTSRFIGADFTRARCFGAGKILAIFCRANSPQVSKDLREMLLALETTGKGYVQYSRIWDTQHRLGTLESLTQNKLMRGLARRLAKHPGEMSCAQSY
jgi:hypothetical protein